MYQVMIVDDDSGIRERLRKQINWSSLGLSICGEAADGDEGFELYEATRPQISILDIKIPNQSGLDLAQQILQRDPDAAILIITGFNDFEYAQKALQLGVSDIIAKPIDMEEMTVSLQKTIRTIDELRAKRNDSEKLQALLQKNMPVLRNRFINSLFSGALAEEDAIRAQMDCFGIHIMNRFYCVAVLAPLWQSTPPQDIALSLVALTNIADELVQLAGFRCESFLDEYNSVIMIISWEKEGLQSCLDDVFSNIRNKYFFYFFIDMYVGIGSTVSQLTELPLAAQDAREALDYKNVFSQNNVVNIKNVVRLLHKSPHNFAFEINEIIRAFKASDYDLLVLQVNALIQNTGARSLASLHNMEHIFVELTALVLHVAQEFGISVGLLEGFEQPYQRILGFDNLRGMVDWFLSLCQILIAAMEQKKETRSSRLIAAARKYIDDHLANCNLGLVEISDAVGLSSTYLCKLFSGEMGIGINQYMNQMRIERSKGLLLDPSKRICDIATEIGYSNPRYFNYIFKKLVGVPPREFRMKE